jgi:23S rRNA (uracil1939-C5)-methyltransferase
MCYGGAGFGRVEGKACFVPLTAPGDQARIRIIKEKRSYLEGELQSLETSSPLRTEPSCPYFGVCGGCHWQQLPYEEQLKQKGEIFADSLRRIGHVQVDEVLSVAASAKVTGYRSRIQLKHVRQNGASRLGFFKSGSHDVVDIASGCAIADPLLNRMAAELRSFLAAMPQGFSIPEVELSIGDSGESIAVIHLSAGGMAQLIARLVEGRDALQSVSGLFVRSGGNQELQHVFGVQSLAYRIPAELFAGGREMTLRFSKGGFSQVNYLQNLELIRTVREWGAFSGKERLLDLYCGNGNISIPIAPVVREVVGVEGYAPSIEDAIANAAANGVANATFQVRDASLAIRRMAKRNERFDVVILDPPRGGAEAAGELARLAPQKIIYISCDPATLARDLGQISANGYRVTRSKPVDMFPQTYHLESVTELVRI